METNDTRHPAESSCLGSVCHRTLPESPVRRSVREALGGPAGAGASRHEGYNAIMTPAAMNQMDHAM